MFKDRWSARIFYFTNSFSDHSEHVFSTYNLHGTKYQGYHCEPEIHICDLMKQIFKHVTMKVLVWLIEAASLVLQWLVIKPQEYTHECHGPSMTGLPITFIK